MSSPDRRSTTPSVIPQKRAVEDEHVPAVPSPLNPNPGKPKAAPVREQREKKESLKKREAKGGPDSRSGTPDPRAPPERRLSDTGPLRYKLAPPKPSDFDLPRSPITTLHHEVAVGDGAAIEFFETSEQ